MTAPVPIWTEAFRVRAYETDPTGSASVPTLCNYLQEAASNHAQALGVSVEQMTEQNLTWVLARLHVEVDAYPRWRQTVHVETWPSGENGLYATREFLFTCGDGRALGRGTSAWLLIDVARRRPLRIPAFVSAIRLSDRGRVMPDTFERLPTLTRADHAYTRRVRYSDLDLNLHVNNVRYVAWALETLPHEMLETHCLVSLEVHFRGETADGDEVAAEAQQLAGPEPAFLHRLVRTSDGREAALARTRWIPIAD
jgi:medium-chain acyl-[acyl-carrier-protein] hydrolase